MQHSGFILVGVVVKPHGIRGEFCIQSYADSPSLFGEVETLYLDDGKNPVRPLSVTRWREHKDKVLLTVKGVTDRNLAEGLRGQDVLVRETDLPVLEDWEHYFYQMIGCQVCLADGAPVGELKGFYETGEQDTWVIESDDGREILLPAVPEFVLDVDLDSEVITIAPPEGLLELYLAPDPPKKKKRNPRRRKKADAS